MRLVMAAVLARRGRAKGQKSYWGEFHGDVTVNRSPQLNPAKFGDGRTLHQRFWGALEMSTMAATSARAGGMTKDERFVILASSLGTVFEWYDFYLYGSLASIIGAQFFSAYPPATSSHCSPSPPAFWFVRSARSCSAASATSSAANTPSSSPS
jgi:hypothetical protein